MKYRFRMGRSAWAAFWCLWVALAACQAKRDEDNRGLGPGTQLPNLLKSGALLNAPVDVGAPRAGWVIYAFSPDSPLCESNHHQVEALADSLPPEWVLLSVAETGDGLPAFFERLSVTVPVLTRVPEIDLSKYQIDETPRTYILDEAWKVIEILEGPYQGEVAERLATRFQVQLAPSSAATHEALLPDQARSKNPEAHPRVEAQRLCQDSQQRPYSVGAKADSLGLRLECKSGGTWIPVS